MKVLILAGGFGTRISEETRVIPKPMIEIGGKPILWHIMKTYSHYGYNDFVILCGYKGEMIKEYFFNYFLHNSSVKFNLKDNVFEVIQSDVEPWTVTCLDTGLNTMTGGRIKRAQEIVGNEPFMLTYGDGVTDVNISELVKNHKESGQELTMTCIQPDGRFGSVQFDDNNNIVDFVEKQKGDLGWINGGYFVCEPQVFDYIQDGDPTIFERAPLEDLAGKKQINSFKHNHFWMCMDTLGDKNHLQQMWDDGKASWKVWS